jgi:hypothetical protein
LFGVHEKLNDTRQVYLRVRIFEAPFPLKGERQFSKNLLVKLPAVFNRLTVAIVDLDQVVHCPGEVLQSVRVVCRWHRHLFQTGAIHGRENPRLIVMLVQNFKHSSHRVFAHGVHSLDFLES